MDEQQYLRLRETVPLEEVSFGYRTVSLYQADELTEAQLGYRFGTSGESFVGDEEGDWKESWLVIASEDSLGEPIFVDVRADELPVYTAAHGQGEWSSELISNSFQGFLAAMEEIERVSHGRSNPVELERNPLSADERAQTLRRIEHVTGSAALDFWESWLGY